MKTVVGIDLDIVVYSCGFSSAGEPLLYCLSTVKKMIKHIVEDTGADEYVGFLTGSNNFRKKRATLQGYKENRKDAPKPEFIQETRDYLMKHHSAINEEDQEADDALGIWLTSGPKDEHRILASIDKDLDMIEGEHYNWRKKELYHVGKEEGDVFFGMQLLTGDSTDNIPGLFKMTQTKALKKVKEQVVDAYMTGGFNAMVAEVANVYTDAAINKPECRIIQEGLTIAAVLSEIGDLLWIRRKDGTYFTDWEKTDG